MYTDKTVTNLNSVGDRCYKITKTTDRPTTDRECTGTTRRNNINNHTRDTQTQFQPRCFGVCRMSSVSLGGATGWPGTGIATAANGQPQFDSQGLPTGTDCGPDWMLCYWILPAVHCGNCTKCTVASFSPLLHISIASTSFLLVFPFNIGRQPSWLELLA